MRDVAVLFNCDHRPRRGEPRDEVSSRGVEQAAAAMAGALAELGHRVHQVGVGSDALAAAEELRRLDPEVVVNLCEGWGEDSSGEMAVAALLELEGHAYTGSGPLALGACVDKGRARAVLAAAGVPVPHGQVVGPGDLVGGERSPAARRLAGLPCPLMVKPAREDASLGIDEASVAATVELALRRAAYVAERYRQPVLVEEFVDGRELTVSVLGEAVLGISEILFELPAGAPRILTYDAKWAESTVAYRGTRSVCPAEVPPAQVAQLGELALRALAALEVRDYARVDFRLHPERGPLCIDVNPNPDLSPDAGYARVLRAAGLGHVDLCRKLLELARGRGHKASPAGTEGTRLRRLQPADRQPLAKLLAGIPQFRPDEVQVALELIDATLALDKPSPDDYRFWVIAAEPDDRPIGYACYGPTPMTDGVHDLYWIAVEPGAQGRGLGQALVRAIEEELRAERARLLVIETSSTDSYGGTRGFYAKIGCAELARLRDFYRPGDDKVIYGKALR